MEDFIPTRVSRIKRDCVNDFVLVNYEKPKKKRSEVIESEKNSNVRSSESLIKENEENRNIDKKKMQELEMKRVRYEVMKFGMSAFKGVEAEKAEVALAVSLGAKPRKKKGINYKVLQHEKKNQKEVQQMDMKLASGFERSLAKHNNQKIHKKDSDGLLGAYGKVSKKILGKTKK